jgi:hypothetical protein
MQLLYHIAEHTGDRLAVRIFADYSGEGRRMMGTGVTFLVVALFFSATTGGAAPGWVRLLAGLGGLALAALFLNMGRSRLTNIHETVYDFDKNRNLFEVRVRVRSDAPPTVESYLLAFVQGATVDLVYDEGYEKFIVIRLLEEKRVRFFWSEYYGMQAEKLMTTINDFLGTPEPQP